MNFNFPVLAPPLVQPQQWNQDVTNLLNQHSVALQQLNVTVQQNRTILQQHTASLQQMNATLQQMNATLQQIQQQQQQPQLPGNMTSEERNASRRSHNRRPGASLLPLYSAGGQLPPAFPANEGALFALGVPALNALLTFYQLPVQGNRHTKAIRLQRFIADCC